jgi:UDP-glucose 4-epimerase
VDVNKRVFISGGAGFIGSAIVQKLQNAGHELMVFDDLSFGNRNFINLANTHFVKENILNKERLMDSLIRFSPNQVIHLAAVHFIPYCNEHPFSSANINIKGTIHLLEACKKLSGLEALFFASTAAVYPISESAIGEDMAPEPGDIYGLSKLAGEELCKKFHLETGIATIICRFFNAFGPNETNPHLIPAIQEQVLGGKRTIKIGNTAPKRDYIHTTDMANAVQLLLNKFDKGIDVFNLGSGAEYSVKEVVEAFEKAVGGPLKMETDPDRVRKTDRLHLLADINKLKQYTGWSPQTSLEDGIKTLLA